jgi:arachidonate 15-lipoxygenase
MAVSDAMLQSASPGDSLDAAFAEGRVFIADYAMMAGLPPNVLGGFKREVGAPVLLLVESSKKLLPFAAKLERKPEAPVFCPKDAWGWELAKLHVAAADTVCGAIYFHHAQTHLVAEPMVVALHRQLAPNHPLRDLLSPHMVGTININHVGSTSVFADHGLIDWIAGTPRSGIRELARQSVQGLSVRDSFFDRRMAKRGVDSLADFPYRDDGKLIYKALYDWVSGYVGLFYASDLAVQQDRELQSWLAEILATDGGALKGLGEGGRFLTKAVLAETLTGFLFAVSASHSAMNFPVSVEMTVIPNSPFAVYRPPPHRTDGWTEADWYATLPPLDQSQRQFGTALLLGESRFGRLGNYAQGQFRDPRVTPLLQAFEVALIDAESIIEERNKVRTPYIHLLPSRISPSINI